MKKLHILNGDSTFQSFDKENVSGDIIVWREILSEGPVMEDINSPEFWNIREKYISSGFSENTENYRIKVIHELKNLNELNNYDEIVLWFEHDLFCQINLIFLINYINSKNFSNTLSVINIDDFMKPGFKGIGELNSDNYIKLYENRFYLNSEDINTAAKAWKIYANTNPLLLNNISGLTSRNLKYLKSALENHKKRFPSIENGLNKIQYDILKIISKNEQPINKTVISYLQQDFIYGLGDSQIINYIKDLSPDIINIFNNFVSLTGTGKNIFSSEMDLFDVMPDYKFYLGGAVVTKANNYRYTTETNLIEKH